MYCEFRFSVRARVLDFFFVVVRWFFDTTRIMAVQVSMAAVAQSSFNAAISQQISQLASAQSQMASTIVSVALI